MEWVWVYLAACVGAIIGYFVAFLCFVSHDADKREQEIFKEYEEMLNDRRIK